MKPLFDTILRHVPAPMPIPTRRCSCRSRCPRLFLLRRPHRRRPHQPCRKVKTGQNVAVMFGTEEEAAEHERTPIKAKIGQVFTFRA